MGFTDKELKEIGISREMAENWQTIMNGVWKHCQTFYSAKMGVNEILIGKYRMGLFMINNKWLEFKIEEGNETHLMVRADVKNIGAITKHIDILLDLPY